ncbi:MAG: hypothetical protein AAGC67_21585 [Myxococcota bacterium]
MPHVSETIPPALQPRVDAAVAWFNASDAAEGDAFEVTGILDPDLALQGADELRLVLCGGGRCEQRSFRVSGTADAWRVGLAEAPAAADASDASGTSGTSGPQAELDPPPGARLRWLDETLARHAFVVLLFYRGFW